MQKTCSNSGTGEVRPPPVLVGPRNAEVVLGLPWRVVSRAARGAGLRGTRIGRARCYLLGELLDALRERDDAPAPTEAPVIDARTRVLRALGRAS